MRAFDLPLTAQMYQSSLALIRSSIGRDRSANGVTRIDVQNVSGDRLAVFLRHSDFYMIGLDFGQGGFHFSDMPKFDDAKALEFAASYYALELHKGALRLNWSDLDQGIRHLSHHKVAKNGSNMFDTDKRIIVQLVFVTSEALRYWTIANDVARILSSPGESLTINDYHGNGCPLTEWENWSHQPDWPMKGIISPHVRPGDRK